MGQIRPNVMKKVKEQGEYLLKQKVVVVQITEWKFEANIARNATFEGHVVPYVCWIWVKNGKKTDYFHKYHFS